MIGKICEIAVENAQGTQLKIGYPSHLRDGSLVLIIQDYGDGFFYVLSELGDLSLICDEYIRICRKNVLLEN